MDALTPDLAEKVLTAEVRNMIKKVSDGGTLSASARAMFHKAALLPGLANQARVAALFKKWACGGRLAADELVELRAWSAAPPDALPDPAAEPMPAAPSQPFALAPEAGPRFAGSRVKYPEPLATYAARYDCAERSIKRMIELGRYEGEKPRVPPDLPPLHSPADMPAWWDRRHPGVRCPAGILQAAAKARKVSHISEPAPTLDSQPASASEPAPEPKNAQPAPAAVQRDFSDIRTLDIAANVEQLRRSLAIVESQLEEARRGTVIEGKLVIDDGVITSRQRDYRETFAELRKAENDLLAWQQTMGELARRDEVRSENNRVAAAIFRAVMRLVTTIRPQLAGKPDAEQDRIWKDEVLACFATLKTAKFTTFDPTAA